MSAYDDPTLARPLPTELLEQCRMGGRRADESGIQATVRAKDLAKFSPPKVDIDALGYDPFDDQPTLINEASWRTAVAPPTGFPLPLHRRAESWMESLPEAARAVLLAATVQVPADAPRLEGAVALPVP